MQNTIEDSTVALMYPEAFEALPEPYQNDSCLEFFLDSDYLHCQPKHDQLAILGQWSCYYDPELQSWCNTKNGEPVH